VQTRCPHCFTWFRIRAEHLSVAGGRVMCGACELEFDALPSLIDDGATAAVAPPSAVADPAEPGDAATVEQVAEQAIGPAAAAMAEPAPVDSGAARDDGVASDDDTTPPAALHQPVAEPAASDVDADRAETAADVPPNDPTARHEYDPGDDALLPAPAAPAADDDDAASTSTQDIPHGLAAETLAAPGDAAAAPPATAADWRVPDLDELLAAEEAAAAAAQVEPPQDAVPAVLAAELAALEQGAGARRGARAWTALSLLGALALASQCLWLARDAVVQRVPAMEALVGAVCAALDCAPRAAKPAAVRLVARDVREHPQYRDALLVNATLVNESTTPQPFPVIQLTLHDATGGVLGVRAFAPSEYLDQSIPIDAGMPSTRPVYLVLELGGRAAGAVSFEFDFL